MADYYNISQLIEICPGSPAQMSLSESGSPWANIPTAPSAGCVHLITLCLFALMGLCPSDTEEDLVAVVPSVLPATQIFLL